MGPAYAPQPRGRLALDERKFLSLLVQFLIEAIFLSAIGAVIGFLVAVVLCAFAGRFFEAGLPISGFAVFLAIIFAISIGLVAGIYPS